jgi:C4-dicarboxylate-specific signal transduction histidine kinase
LSKTLFSTVANATERMNRLLAQLRKGPPVGRTARSVALTRAVQRAVQSRAAQSPIPVAIVHDEPWVQADPERLVAVLEHLIQNAQEARAQQVVVEVVVYRRSDRSSGSA